jgi:acyl-[acyl-carrier-protein]-phospholipid O-acyltransferase / long-chain-fatty-acid--[acyl-carrier-protein] ligase
MPAEENHSVPEPEKKWRFGFWSLIATQFQGAFNDNGLKFFVIFLILGTNPTDSQKDLLVFVIGNLFALPFLLFSMAGGFLADRFSKRSVAIATKVFEVCAMLFAMYAFTRGNTRMAYAVIFLASTQAAFFGPSKYGLLPELLPDRLLSWGNGILELTTFVAIIAGAVIGP